jgi:hypothetical protein
MIYVIIIIIIIIIIIPVRSTLILYMKQIRYRNDENCEDEGSKISTRKHCTYPHI